ncbi:MAG: PIN domain-containing protein [Verrucomicrobiales bacterium]|nr:PIN domain-containing protein [Verrucomicrobiales bacterium]
MNDTKVVVDTNVFFPCCCAALVPAADRFQIRTDHSRTYYCPRFFLVELFKHKERIASISELDEQEMLEGLHELLTRIQFLEEGGIPIGTWMEARRLCRMWI